MTRPWSPTGRPRLASIGRSHIAREPWPDFEAFAPERYELALRQRAARQWWRRAREEYGSIHEFTQLAHALAGIRAPIELLSALSRLITDEARHAALCVAMAQALDAEADFDWTPPRPPWPPPPTAPDDVLRWAADAILCACCIGETVSRPLYEAVATLCTDPVPETVLRQILRDEHLHATFGWEALAWLLPRVDPADVEASMRRRLRGFERSCVPPDLSVADLTGVVEVTPPGPDAPPNLGSISPRLYATIFYATIEAEILPRFHALGLDAARAWAQRGP